MLSRTIEEELESKLTNFYLNYRELFKTEESDYAKHISDIIGTKRTVIVSDYQLSVDDLLFLRKLKKSIKIKIINRPLVSGSVEETEVYENVKFDRFLIMDFGKESEKIIVLKDYKEINIFKIEYEILYKYRKEIENDIMYPWY